jgi:general nucleoside transport system permease protein
MDNQKSLNTTFWGKLGVLKPLLPITTAVVLAFLAGALLLISTGQNPIPAFAGLFQGAVGNRNAIAGTLTTTTPLIFSALSFLVAYRAGIFNAGNEGQLLIGAIFASVAGFSFPGLPSFLYIPVVLLAGALGGALWSFLPAIWRLYLGVNELVTTLMMNYIATLLNGFLVMNVWRSSTVQPGTNAQTITMNPNAIFPSLFPPYAVTLALPLGILLAILIHWVLFRTVWGYELRMSGQQPLFADYGGVSVRNMRLLAMLLSGALAGLGGAAQVGGVFHAYVNPFTEGLGFNGVLIALLVHNNALLIPVGAFFFGALQSGALKMQIFTNVSRYIIGVLTATLILFTSTQQLGFSPKESLARLFAWFHAKFLTKPDSTKPDSKGI